MRSGATPQRSRCAPTPSAVTMGTPVLAPAPRMVRAAEVIVVVVREQHGVERGQLVERRRARGGSASGPAKRHGRGALAEDRIGEDAQAVELEQHRAVAEPGGAKAGLGGACPGLVRALERQRRRRARAGRRRRSTRRERQRIALELGAQARRVAEDAVGELARGEGPFATEPGALLELVHGAKLSRSPLLSSAR